MRLMLFCFIICLRFQTNASFPKSKDLRESDSLPTESMLFWFHVAECDADSMVDKEREKYL